MCRNGLTALRRRCPNNCELTPSAHHFLQRMAIAVSRETDSGHVTIDGDNAIRLYKIAVRYRRMDAEAAEHVEGTICMRSHHFTGELPYVGWRGLGLALNQDYDELAELREQVKK